MEQEKYIVFDIETFGLRALEGRPITCICALDSKGDRLNCSGNNEITFFKEEK